ncbi:polysaccharide deacetylase family protein [Domibacillus robiginosus]|uniref:polysaccharide deacetylase family protein n=1 Tax=Domibacillus robiginosus TaxID=1071054 RepID=UPI00067E00DA|nr:polysaccharide deacetylase family protein [Domibacillus robiginosus]
MKKLLTAGLLLAASWTVLPTIYARSCAKAVKKQGPDRPEIALTFDDGPNPAYTPLLLDLLKQYNVKATFFVIGEKAKLYPDLIRRMEKEGHEIGLHNNRHVSSWLLSPLGLEQELAEAASCLAAITGKRAELYRPPWGHFNPFTLQKAHALQTVMWTSIPGDWKKKMSPEKLAQKLRLARFNGAIITLHDSGHTFGAYEKAPMVMLEALRLFLTDKESAAFSFVTVSTLYRSEP